MTRPGASPFLIGGGVGIGGIFGSLYRSQAYPNTPTADPGTPSQWSACRSASDGKGTYCREPDNNHYWPGWSSKSPGQVGASAYNEASWANGGSKPMIFPWIAIPQIGFRYKPIKQFQVKADLGLSTSGIFFGLSASYGLPTSASASGGSAGK